VPQTSKHGHLWDNADEKQDTEMKSQLAQKQETNPSCVFQRQCQIMRAQYKKNRNEQHIISTEEANTNLRSKLS
jgi:hypothetical protein